MQKLKIAIVEPFYTDSHKQWIDGLVQFVPHQYTLLTLPGRHWKWRMQGAAVELAKQYNQLNQTFDFIIASDMLNVALFKALVQSEQQNKHPTPIAVYFHENQLTYPWSKTDVDPQLKRDAAYQFINYTSTLCGDAIFFNSQYHQQSFLNALPTFLNQFPDYKNLDTIQSIQQKSKVLPIGLNLKKMDAFAHFQNQRNEQNEYPLILWNHRWEYDKNPDEFFDILKQLKERGVKFKLVVLGKAYQKRPEIFNRVPEIFKDELQHIGYCESEEEYIKWLHLADILPVTTTQDFFGISVIEATYCNTIPLLPMRLAYPEHIPQSHHSTFFYEDTKDLTNRLQRLIFNVKILRKQKVSNFVEKYDWSKLLNIYQFAFQKLSFLIEKEH